MSQLSNAANYHRHAAAARGPQVVLRRWLRGHKTIASPVANTSFAVWQICARCSSTWALGSGIVILVDSNKLQDLDRKLPLGLERAKNHTDASVMGSIRSHKRELGSHR